MRYSINPKDVIVLRFIQKKKQFHQHQHQTIFVIIECSAKIALRVP